MITLTLSSTHFYLLNCQGGWLLVDAGWDLGQFLHQLKAHQVPVKDIRYVMFTHHHPDHAGLIQEIRDLSGAKLIIHEKQIPFIKALNALSAKMSQAKPLEVHPGDLISPNREVLRSIGILGEIVETPGHSPDHVTLVLDDSSAFTGDLPLPEYSTEEQLDEVQASWRRLLDLGARAIYPSHGPTPFPASRIAFV